MLRHPTASGPQQITLGGTAYSVELGAAQGGPLSLRLCDSITGAAWAASFPKAALERLTLNAGSFKAFDVFVRMLQAALQGGSEGLTLELLSPAELRQNGSNNNSADGAASDASQRGDAAAADAAGRRFLILNYTTEFDRVRFPLPLDVAHAPQAEELADRLRHMHHAMAEQQRKAEEDARRRAEEAARAEAQGRAAQQAQQQAQQAQASLQPQAMAAFAPPPAWSGELAQQPLPQANASATQVASAAPPAHQQEQDAGWQQAAHKLHARLQSTEAALQEAQAENRRLRREREFAKQADAAEAQRAPDMQVLREIVTALERDILEQKTRYQRALQQRSARIEDLETELAGLRASERSLRLKCRSQLAELNDLKQRRGGSGAGRSQSRGEAAATKPPWRSGSASGRSTERGRNQSRGPARSTSRSAGRVPSTHRGAPSGTAAVARPARSRSTGRAPTAGSDRSASAGRRSSATRTRSPSPARFDPTAYIRAREEKLRAIQARRETQERGLRNRSSSRERTPSPVVGERLARASAGRRRTISVSPMGPPQRVRARSRSADRQDRGTQPTPPSARRPLSSVQSPASIPRRKAAHVPAHVSSPGEKSTAQPPSTEEPAHLVSMDEIDARLSALQNYLSAVQK